MKTITQVLNAVLLLAFAGTASVHAQTSAQVDQARALGFDRLSVDREQRVDYLGGQSIYRARSSGEVSRLLSSDLAETLGLTGSEARVSTSRSDGARNYYRAQQHYRGYPVIGGELVLQTASDGRVEAVIGRGRDLAALAINRGQPFESALKSALGDFVARLGRAAPSTQATSASSVRVLNTPRLAVYALGKAPVLVHEAMVEFYLGRERFIERLLIDAGSGRLVNSYTQIHTALTRNIYNLNGGCVAAFGGASLPGTLVMSEGGTSTDAIATAAYNHSGTVYWYYRNAFNRDGIKNNGSPVNSTVRVTFGQFFATNCTGANAAWIDTEQLMVFGTGDANNFKDLTSGGDVAYHEMTHGVTSAESNLAYQKESGGINEGMSDIFAAAAEAWAINVAGRGLQPGAGVSIAYTVEPRVWLVGDEIVKPGFGRAALRFMNDPEADNYSVDHYADYQSRWGDACSPSQDNDQCGVHGSSGIPNLAFQLLVAGGQHPRGQTTVQVPAIGMADAIRIFYEANTNLLSQNSNFQALRNATVQAASNFFGASSCQKNAVTLAWNAVGVPGDTTANPGACGGGGGNVAPVAGFNVTTSGLTANFTDGSSDSDGTIAARNWNFGDGSSSTATNPSKTYAAAGTYNVTLTVTDDDGSSNATTRAVTVSAAANVAPVANFSFVASGLSVNFTDASSDSDGAIASRSWNFGDGSTSTATNPSKTYAAAGTYNVSLTVTDNQGASHTRTQSLTVNTISTELLNGVARTGLGANQGQSLNFTMTVPAHATNLRFVMSGGTGDADLYVRFGSQPTDTVYDCRPYLSGNSETCSISTAQAGVYYVRIKAYSTFANVSLTGSYSIAGPSFSNTTVFNIPDNNATGIQSPITVSGVGGNAPSTLRVGVNITHPYIGDLKVDLLAPDGSVYVLHNRSGGGADNIVTTYTVNASSEVANGTWRLRVVDAAAADVGRLNSWTLQF